MSLHYLVLGWHRDPPSIFRGMDSSSAGPSVWDLGRRDGSESPMLWKTSARNVSSQKMPSKIKKTHRTGAFSCQSSIQRKPGEYSFQYVQFNKAVGSLGVGNISHDSHGSSQSSQGFHGRGTDPNKALCFGPKGCPACYLCCPQRMEFWMESGSFCATNSRSQSPLVARFRISSWSMCSWLLHSSPPDSLVSRRTTVCFQSLALLEKDQSLSLKEWIQRIIDDGRLKAQLHTLHTSQDPIEPFLHQLGVSPFVPVCPFARWCFVRSWWRASERKHLRSWGFLLG